MAGLKLVLDGLKAISARSGVSGEQYAVETGSTVRIPRLELQDVVLVRCETRG